MTVVYPYLDFGGSLSPGRSGYERSIGLPAGVKYNLFFIEGNQASVCLFQPVNRGGDYSPHSARNHGAQPRIEIYENVYGWVPFVRIIDLCGAFQPTSSLGFAGTTSVGFAVPPTGINISNPANFRVNYPGSPQFDVTMSWSGVNLGLSDTCQLLSTPTEIVGVGELGTWTSVGAPVSQANRPTLPNGGPLAGRNRAQIIA